MTDTGSDQNEKNNQEAVVDGRFRLKVSRDKLTVHMDSLQAPSGGGNPIKAKQVHSKLKKLDIKYGIDNTKIDEILTALNENRLPNAASPAQADARSKESPEQEENSAQQEEESYLCIVKGDPPVHGQQASLQWHINIEEAQDYAVLPDELIATYSPPTQGEAGKNIFGKKINAQPGRDDTVKPGDGIEQLRVDGNIEYRAKWFGTLQNKDNTLTVDCPLKISADNMSVTLHGLQPYPENRTLELNHIISTLQQHNITFGIKENVLTEALTTLNESRQAVTELVIAEGTPVIHGLDASIKWHYDPTEHVAKDFVIRHGELIATRQLITTGEPGTDIHGNVIPATAGKDIAIQIGDNIVEDESSHECRSTTLGLLKYKTTEGTIHLSIDPGLEVTDNAMEARLNLFKTAADGTAIETADIIQALETGGIKYGIDATAIEAALKSSAKDKSDQLKQTLVAQGRPPQDGIDAHIIYSQKENIAGQELAKGRIDFHEHNYLWSFNKGDSIGHIVKAKAEEDGINLWGEPITATPPNEMQLTLEGAHIDTHNEIIADVDGTLIINGLHLCLTDLSVIDGNVAQKTGNIHSTNSVHVKGHVEPGFVVESQKSIIIDKNVEDACIRSGGSITIKGGIRGLKSEVYASGEVSAEFIENADVSVNSHVNVTGSIINSKVSSNSTVTVGSQQSKHSAIIGGQITAHTRIEAFVLGSSAYRKTIISVGFTQEAKQQQRDLKREIETKEKELVRLDQIKTHSQLNTVPDLDEIMRKVNATRDATTKDIAALNEQLNKIIQTLNQSNDVRIIVHKKVFPGVIIKINEHAYEVTREMSGGIFTINNDEIIFCPR